MSDSITEEVKKFVKEKGLVRQKEVEEAGFSSRLLYRLRDQGELIQLGPGLFTHPDSQISERQTYAEAAKLVPKGVVCLLSALSFHNVGTQMPGRIWIALNREVVKNRPRIEDFPLEFAWFSGAAFEEGQEKHDVEGIDVRVYNPAKTVADLFKYRHKLGVDVGIEALREGWRDRLFSVDHLMHYAEICNVSNVMRPYLRSLVAGS